jgi:hypothetical protein
VQCEVRLYVRCEVRFGVGFADASVGVEGSGPGRAKGTVMMNLGEVANCSGCREKWAIAAQPADPSYPRPRLGTMLAPTETEGREGLFPLKKLHVPSVSAFLSVADGESAGARSLIGRAIHDMLTGATSDGRRMDSLI